MTEHEYLLSTNLAKVRIIKNIAADLFASEKCGVTESEKRLIATAAHKIEARILSVIDDDKININQQFHW